jgi:cyclase
MSEKRIIAALDIAGGRVVKGVNFIGHDDIGDPVEIAKRYAEQGADEIIILDIMASYEGRGTTYALIERAARDLSVPVVIAGGIRSLDDFKKAFDCGASKVGVTSAAVADPGLIHEASASFGGKKIVAAIDAKRVGDCWRVFVKGGRENTGLELLEWVKKCESLGAGEILLNSMDGDGTRQGFDIAMTKAVTDAATLPVTASGGCGQVSHVIDVFKQTGCAAALVASLLHYGKATVSDIKREMELNGI